MKRYMKLASSLPWMGLVVFLAAGCAVDGGVSEGGPQRVPPSVTAAEIGLAPALRPFHDELEPYGDWVLVEPQGWVFRPRVNTVAWRPYQDGRWVPSYAYGWVWESNEPFGWITDHYGFWFHDSFQGWVWQPYGAWAPSWVAWVQVGDYVGWAPLPPAGVSSYEAVPSGLFTYVNSHTLATGGASSRASFANDIPDETHEVRPIDRIVSRQGVHWNAGPDPEAILGLGAADRLRTDEREGRAAVPSPPRNLEEVAEVDLQLLEARNFRAWSEARRELAAKRAQRAAPPRGPTGPPVQPAPAPATPAPQRIKPAPAPRDTSQESDSLAKIKRIVRPDAPRPPRRRPN